MSFLVGTVHSWYVYCRRHRKRRGLFRYQAHCCPSGAMQPYGRSYFCRVNMGRGWGASEKMSAVPLCQTCRFRENHWQDSPWVRNPQRKGFIRKVFQQATSKDSMYLWKNEKEISHAELPHSSGNNLTCKNWCSRAASASFLFLPILQRSMPALGQCPDHLKRSYIRTSQLSVWKTNMKT